MDSDGLPGLLRDLTRIARELPARIVFENSHHLARLPEPVRRRVLSSLDGRPLRGRRLDSPRFASPLERRAFFVSSEYGLREHNRHHNGIDLAAEAGTPIMAAADGVVAVSRHEEGGYGNFVEVEHDGGWRTLYAHCEASNLRRVGEAVGRGDVIARVGSTGRSSGPHLHFEIRDPSDDPQDPSHFVFFSRSRPPG